MFLWFSVFSVFVSLNIVCPFFDISIFVNGMRLHCCQIEQVEDKSKRKKTRCAHFDDRKGCHSSKYVRETYGRIDCRF